MSEPVGDDAAAANAPTVVLTTVATEVPALPEPPPLPVDLPQPQPLPATPTLLSLFGNFLLDVLIAGALLIGFSTLFSLPIVIVEMLALPGGFGGAGDVNAIVAGAIAELTVASILATLATAVVLWLLRGRRFVDARAPLRPLPAYALSVFAGIGIQVACLGISLLATSLEMPLDPTNVAPITALAQEWPWLAWTVVVLLAPFAEELLFRHVLMRRFAVAGRGVFGLVASALLFAYIHEPTPWNADFATWLVTTSTYVAMGLGFGAVYLRTRRLGAAFVAHATCNLLAMLLLAFSVS